MKHYYCKHCVNYISSEYTNFEILSHVNIFFVFFSNYASTLPRLFPVAEVMAQKPPPCGIDKVNLIISYHILKEGNVQSKI